MSTSFLPVSSFELPRFAGVPTFMRLPHIALDHADVSQVKVGFVGVPWDGGTTNRPGARHGPRALRDASTMIRLIHPVHNINPFEIVNCADMGDVSPNPVDVQDTLARVTAFYDKLVDLGIRPMTAGGDHLVSLPVLRSLAKERPLGMIHFDAHTDLWDSYFGGYKFTHGTPFRRAVEEGLLDPKRIIQIGIRGTMADREDIDFAAANGIRLVRIEELMARGVTDVMEEARTIAGSDPIYVSFDIDGIDPSYAPGTGTPEIGGFTTFEAQCMVRELRGLDIVGCDLVEVSPPFDPSGTTAWIGASMMFELLCPLVESAKRANK
ncbi:MAG: guanidinopropionase [Hyphomicrobiaceae bacterium]|jgi:guanidinopropionase